MRAVVQRVGPSSVWIGVEEGAGTCTGAIDKGLLAYVGVQLGDTDKDLAYVRDKLLGLRVFTDASGKMSLDVGATGGSILLVPQFTLFGDVRGGRRPAFVQAERPDIAAATFEALVAQVRARGVPCETGRFAASMVVRSEGLGPVTILIDSRKLF